MANETDKNDVYARDIHSQGDVVVGSKEVHHHYGTAPEPTANSPTPQVARYAQALMPLLAQYFSLSDMAQLEFELGLLDGSIAGATVTDHARALVTHCQQNARLNQLNALMQNARPFLRETLQAAMAESAQAESNQPPIPSPIQQEKTQMSEPEPQPTPPSGGITAKRIWADNIVSGTQISGLSGAEAATLMGQAKDIKAGRITADDIIAKNVVAGLQVIGKSGKAPTYDDLRAEIAALREQLQQAIAAGAIADPDDAEDATKAVARAEEEAGKPEPIGERVVKNLEKTGTILSKVSEAVDKVGAVGASVLKLAPIASALAAIAAKLFGL